MTRVVIVGGGASVKEGIEQGLWKKIADEEVWSVNYAFKSMPYLPRKEVWVDVAFFKNNAEDLHMLHTKGVEMITRKHPVHAGILEFTRQYNSTRIATSYFGREAIAKNCLYYGRMGLSGMYALSLAIAENHSEIFLLGYDFGTVSIIEKNTHFYQDKIKVYSTGVNHPEIYRMPNNTVKREMEDFRIYNQTNDVKIWNVSERSNIDAFEKISYETMFQKLEKK